jgi:hypothetical protein
MFCASAFSCYLSPQIDARPFINFFVLLTPAFSGFPIYLQTYVAMRFVFDTASGKSCLGCRIYSYSSFRLAEIAYSQVFTVYQMKLCRILGCNFPTSQTAVSIGSNVSCRKKYYLFHFAYCTRKDFNHRLGYSNLYTHFLHIPISEVQEACRSCFSMI